MPKHAKTSDGAKDYLWAWPCLFGGCFARKLAPLLGMRTDARQLTCPRDANGQNLINRQGDGLLRVALLASSNPPGKSPFSALCRSAARHYPRGELALPPSVKRHREMMDDCVLFVEFILICICFFLLSCYSTA